MKKAFVTFTAVLLALLTLLSACTPAPAPQDTAYIRGGLEFETGEGIDKMSTAIKGADGGDNTLLCADTGAQAFSATALVTVGGATSGEIVFKYYDDENYYSLSFDYKKNRIILSFYRAGKLNSSSAKNLPDKLSDGVSLRIESEKTFFSVYAGKAGEERFLFDCVSRLTQTQGFKIDLGVTAAITVDNLEYTARDSVTVDKAEMYMNPVAEGADPFVYYEDGVYYLYATNAANEGYKVSTSTDLVNWTEKGFCLRDRDVYGNAESSHGFWAPEVYKYGDKYYMIYTVTEHLGIAVADSPLGPFKNDSGTFLNNNKREIDGHLFFDDDGRVYIFFVRTGKSATTGKNGNEIFGAEFDMETLTYKNERLLIYPEANTWEFIDGYIAEGPEVIKHNGVYYLTYSANGYTSKNYAIGCATSVNPLGAYTKYEDNPILSQSPLSGVFGPGHHCFITTTGGQPLIVYHRHFSSSEVSPRRTCIDTIEFVKNPAGGNDILTVNGPTTVYTTIPR